MKRYYSVSIKQDENNFVVKLNKSDLESLIFSSESDGRILPQDIIAWAFWNLGKKGDVKNSLVCNISSHGGMVYYTYK